MPLTYPKLAVNPVLSPILAGLLLDVVGITWLFSRPLSCPSPFHVATQLKNTDGVNWTRCDQKRSMMKIMIQWPLIAGNWSVFFFIDLPKRFFRWYHFCIFLLSSLPMCLLAKVQAPAWGCCQEKMQEFRCKDCWVINLPKSWLQKHSNRFKPFFSEHEWLYCQDKPCECTDGIQTSWHHHDMLTAPGGERGLWQLPPAARLEMLRPLIWVHWFPKTQFEWGKLRKPIIKYYKPYICI